MRAMATGRPYFWGEFRAFGEEQGGPCRVDEMRLVRARRPPLGRAPGRLEAARSSNQSSAMPSNGGDRSVGWGAGWL